MTLGVCEAKSVWLEIIKTEPVNPHQKKIAVVESVKEEFVTVGIKNIPYEEIHDIMKSGGYLLKKQVLETKLPIVVDNIRDDKRTQNIKQGNSRFGSIAIMPLLSHETVIGILYVTKAVEYGFDKDDIEVIQTY